MSYTQIRNPPAPFTPPNPQIIHNYAPNSRMPFIPPNPNANIASQQQQQQQHTPAQPPQQASQPSGQIQQPTNPQARMAPAQQPQGAQQTSTNNSQPQQNTFHPASQQQMPSNMQQQPGSQPAAQIQPGQIPTQFTSYVNPTEQQHTGNAGAFIYNTNQRISIPHQGQAPNQVPPGAAQAASHHSYSNQQHYMYQQQYAGPMNYYDPNLVAQQYINAGAAYTSQGYIYTPNPNAVNMYNQTRSQPHPTQGVQMSVRYSNDSAQQHQLQPNQQQPHHPSQTGHHLQGPPSQQVHPTIIQQQQQNAQQPPQNSQQNAQQQQHQLNHQSQQAIHQQLPPQINPQLVPAASQQPPPGPIFTPSYSQPAYPPQAPVPIPSAPTYQKRERKPLLIIDPTTMTAVNAVAAEKADAAKEASLAKSSTQPSISSINQSNTPGHASQPTVAASASISAISTSSSGGSSKPETAASSVPVASTTNSSSAQSSVSSAAVVAGAGSKSDNANQLNTAPNSNENKKKSTDHEIQSTFALQVLNRKQENDVKSKQATPTPPAPVQTPTTTPASAQAQPPTQVITAATVVAGLVAPSKMNANNNTTETNKSEQTTTVTPAQPKQTQNTNANNTKQQQVPAASQPVKPQPEAVKPAAEPSQPTAPKVFSYKDAVAKPAVAQAVPKTAIPTARQTPPAQQPSTQTSMTITNSKVEPAAGTTSKPVQQQSTNNSSDVGKSKQQPTSDKAKPVVAASVESSASKPTGKEVSSNTKPSYSKAANADNNTKLADNSKRPPTAAEVVATPPTPQPQAPAAPVTEPLTATKPSAEAPKPTVATKPKEDDKKISPPVTATPTPTTSTTATAAPVTKTAEAKTPLPTSIPSQAPAETMPTVVVNTDNKINSLPEVPAVAEAKSGFVAENGAVKAAEAPVSAGAETEEKLDCWTPENKDAKKRYNREFLLSLKDKKLSKTFPDALVNFELAVMDQNATKPVQQMSDQYGGRASYAGRSSFGGNSMDRDTGYNNKGSMRREYKGQKKNKESFHANQPPVVINLQSHEIVLKKTETPYVIKKLTSDNLNEDEELYRETRSILNKLTPENLQKLTVSLINLPITNEVRLRNCIDIIFEKAIDEQVFSQTYGQLSKVLAQIKVPSSSDPTKNVNFRTMLLTRCQKEFDTDYIQGINYDKLIAEAENEANEDKRKELQELAEYKLGKAKRRSLGNIRFIGELFKLQMLTEGIMNDCIERLLKTESDEENIECLCRLLTTIGKEVDKSSNAAKMKSYFDRLERIVKKRDSTTARIRFMILDIIELRKNAWVPRRKDNAPRRIEEIRAEAEEERLKLEAQIAANQANERNMRNQSGQRGATRGSGGYAGKSSMDNENYNRAQKNTNTNINMVKKITEVKSITNRSNNSELTLGPGGSSGFSWNKPAAAQADTTAAASATLTSSTSFSSGSSFSSKYQSGGDDQYNRGSSNYAKSTHFSSKHTSDSGMASRLSMDSNRGWANNKNSQVQNVKKMEGGYSGQNVNTSNNSSRASSREGSTSRPVDSRENSTSRSSATTAPAKGTRTYTSEEIDRKVTVTLAEYIENEDLAEALKDCEEFRPAKEAQTVEFIEFALTKVLEKTEKDRTAVGVLLYNAVLKQKKLPLSAFTQALKNTLECAEDMAIDVPKIATYLAQIIAPMFQKDASVEFLTEACEPIRDKAICGDFIAETLTAASKRLGHSTVAEIFKVSKLKIHDFLEGVENSTEFLKEKNIQWIMGNRERTQSASVSTESYEKKLFEIVQCKSENEVIFEKIENEFSDSDCAAKAFIRALVTAVCRSCLIAPESQSASSKDKVDSQIFKKRSPILTKFINHNAELELEALYAVQALDHRMQHQPGFILFLFDILFDEDIISEAIFWQWMKEPREEGHAISALSLKVFFEWLSETDANESS